MNGQSLWFLGILGSHLLNLCSPKETMKILLYNILPIGELYYAVLIISDLPVQSSFLVPSIDARNTVGGNNLSKTKASKDWSG